MDTGNEPAIVATVLDYFEGWFEGDPSRMERALHPSLAKRSLAGAPARPGAPDAADAGALDEVTAEGMIDATALGTGTTRLAPGADARIEVEVVDVYDSIASVTVRSAVYHEYLHLVRTGSGWRIANALWQPTRPGGDGA